MLCSALLGRCLRSLVRVSTDAAGMTALVRTERAAVATARRRRDMAQAGEKAGSRSVSQLLSDATKRSLNSPNASHSGVRLKTIK